MHERIVKRIAALMSVKSIVTIVLTAVFAYLAVTGIIDGDGFMTIFLMVVSFYFGTQSQKAQDIIDNGGNNE